MSARVKDSPVCRVLHRLVTEKLRYVDGRPEIAGFNRVCLDLDQSTGSAFLHRDHYDQTIGVALAASAEMSLLIVDMAPAIEPSAVGGLDCNYQVVESSWSAFNDFQIALISGRHYLVDVAIFDASLSWVLLKTLEGVHFFSESKGMEAIKPIP